MTLRPIRRLRRNVWSSPPFSFLPLRSVGFWLDTLPPSLYYWVCLVLQAETRLSILSNARSGACEGMCDPLRRSPSFLSVRSRDWEGIGILIRYPLVGLLSLLSLPGWDETFNSLKRPIRRLRRNVWWFPKFAVMQGFLIHQMTHRPIRYHRLCVLFFFLPKRTTIGLLIFSILFMQT
jgi:hypothetical protein